MLTCFEASFIFSENFQTEQSIEKNFHKRWQLMCHYSIKVQVTLHQKSIIVIKDITLA